MLRSHWLEEALAAESDEAPALEGETRADVCIVGGGYCGLWTALELKEREPSLDVAVIEADICGGGASGRNGGFLMTWWVKFLPLQQLCGSERALMLAQASQENVGEIAAFCSGAGIDPHFRRDGWLWTATGPAQVGAWQDTMTALERHQVYPFKELPPEEVAERSGSADNIAGVFEADAATVQPALLARGLRRVALARGVRIYERTPMTALDRTRPPRVRTPRGTVRAERVVLALNAWGARFRELRQRMVVVGGNMVATATAPERLAEIGLRDGVAMSDSRLFVRYWRTTLDGRLALGRALGHFAFGARIGAAFEGTSRRATEIAEHIHGLYPGLRDVPIAASWTGPIAKSASGVPFFGHLGGREDILYAAGFSGNGVGPTRIGGRILASLALEADDEWANCGLVDAKVGTYPPEPFRYVGAHMVRAAISVKERAEDAGEKPGALVSRLAALGPAGLTPITSDHADQD
jgi:putative aminophosphonate oxidoreductase